MCGIYGFIGCPTKKTRKAVYMLALLNESRGRDSTGIAVVTQGSYYLDKQAIQARDFLMHPKILSKIPKHKKVKTIVMGHTRAATMGAVNNENAHPFRIGTYLMTHNGSLNNTHTLSTSYKIDYEVDSQYIGYLLNILEHDDIFSDKLIGWWAVPYVDLTTPLKLSIARHFAPCYIAYTDHGMYYASELEHLQGGLSYAGIPYSSPASLQNNTINDFTIETGRSSRRINVVRTTREHREPRSFSYRGHHDYYNDYVPSWKKKKKKKAIAKRKHKSYIDQITEDIDESLDNIDNLQGRKIA